MHRPPTLDDVAEAAGVSRSTASRATNGGLRVSPAAQAAVDAAVARLGYAPNRAARSLVTRRTDTVALVIPETDERFLTDPFLAGLLRGVNDALGGTDLHLVLLLARASEPPGRIGRYLSAGHVDGVVIASHHRDDGLAEALREASLPAVFIGRPIDPRAGLAYVDCDNTTGAATATRRLIAAGRRAIATVAGPQDMAAGIDRLAGWRAAMSEAGLPEGAVAFGDFQAAGGSAAMERLLDEHPELDAVFVASDPMAIAAMRVLARRGRRIPDDVAVIGFDDLAAAAEATPPLTTMHNPVVKMSRTATELVLELAAGRQAPERATIFETPLVERESA